MPDTPLWITAACDGDMATRSGAVAIAREAFTVEDAVRMYAQHQQQAMENEKTTPS